jgi:hypothetical protein
MERPPNAAVCEKLTETTTEPMGEWPEPNRARKRGRARPCRRLWQQAANGRYNSTTTSPRASTTSTTLPRVCSNKFNKVVRSSECRMVFPGWSRSCHGHTGEDMNAGLQRPPTRANLAPSTSAGSITQNRWRLLHTRGRPRVGLPRKLAPRHQ